MNLQEPNKKHYIVGGFLEAIRKNVSFLSKIPLFLALPITVLLALGITLSPALYGIMLALLPFIIVSAAIIGFVNFMNNLNKTKHRSEHNLIPGLELEIQEKKSVIADLENEIAELLADPSLSSRKRKKIQERLEEIQMTRIHPPKPNFLQKILQKLPGSIELFFKYFVIIPGSIGAFGGILFLVASSFGINVFQMGAIVTFMTLTGIGGLAAFGIVIGVSIIAMIALIFYKAKFEEKMSAQHKKIHEQELYLHAQAQKLSQEISELIKIKRSTHTRSSELPAIMTNNHTTVVIADKQITPNKFYTQKKSKAYIISGAILAAINEAVFMYSKYITFTGLCLVILGGLGITFSPAFFIVLTATLTVFTLIMAAIGVSKFLGNVKNVNALAEDPVLQDLRSQVQLIPNADLSALEQANKADVRKTEIRVIEAVIRYGYLFAVALGAITSGTILAAGIAGIGITGLGAILSASVLSGFGIPLAAAIVLTATIVIAGTLIFYKKKYENPLAKAQRDAAFEKATLINIINKSQQVDSAPKNPTVMQTIRHTNARNYQNPTDIKPPSFDRMLNSTIKPPSYESFSDSNVHSSTHSIYPAASTDRYQL